MSRINVSVGTGQIGVTVNRTSITCADGEILDAGGGTLATVASGGTLDYSAITVDPSTLPNLAFLFDAALGVTESGGLVSNWADQSGNGHDLTASTTARPTLEAANADFNNEPTLNFNGSSNTMVTASASLISVVECIMVLNNQNTSPYSDFLGFVNGKENSGTGSQRFFITGGPTLTTLRDVATDQWYSDITVDYVPSVTVPFSATASIVWAATRNPSGALAGLSVGRQSTSATRFSNFDIAYLAGFSSYLSQDERNLVHNFLIEKYK